MSIPRAKITPLGHSWAWDVRCTACKWRDQDLVSWQYAADAAHKHLAERHGERTVGSLTADDVGKWVELDGREPFRIANVYHGRTMTGVGNGCLSGPWLPSSTVCRVTEARP